MLPQQFKANYLTQQMAMKVGRQLSRNDFYGEPSWMLAMVRSKLYDIIEKESGRGFPDVCSHVKTLDLAEFINKCKPFAK